MKLNIILHVAVDKKRFCPLCTAGKSLFYPLGMYNFVVFGGNFIFSLVFLHPSPSDRDTDYTLAGKQNFPQARTQLLRYTHILKVCQDKTSDKTVTIYTTSAF